MVLPSQTQPLEFWASFFSALFPHFPHPLNLRTCPSQGREVEKEFAKV